MKPVYPRPTRRPGGFALVISLSLMVLLTVLATGLLSLGTLSLRAGTAGEDMAKARANARMALMLALGDLQKSAGRDQAVTANAALLGQDIRHPQWTGVWKDGGEAHWLVSQPKDDAPVDPAEALATEQVELVPETDDLDPVQVPAVKLGANEAPTERYAWWIADESVKARVDLGDGKEGAEFSKQERLARSLSAQAPSLLHAGEEWSELEEDLPASSLISMPTAAMAASGKELSGRYFHDLTSGGHGLPVNVRDGGMKVDLSTVFDTSDRNHAQTVAGYFGAAPAKTTLGRAQVSRFTPPGGGDAAKKFFLVEDLVRGGPVGPNWGILYNYAQLYQNLSGSQAQLIGALPELYTDIRSSNWAPYTNHRFNEFSDTQQVSSGIRPVISTLQMGFRLKAKPAAPPAGASGGSYYQIQIEVKPLVGLWNPYNVSIPASSYRLDWAVYPYMRLGISKGTFQPRPRVWLRESWLSNSDYPESTQNRWFQLQTDAVDFEPGEVRLFSVTSKATMADVNKLSPAWGREGAFTLDLKWNAFDGSPPGKAGQPMVVEAGSEVWIGDLFIEDTQHPETKLKFPTVSDASSASWATLKTTDNQTLSRYSDVWTSGKSGSGWAVPEQLISEWEQTGVTAPRYSVEHLATTHEHMGTWAMKVRTSTEAVKADRASGAATQALRGWVDSNPRALASNPLWDGSKAGARGMEGWWFCSQMIGGTHSGRHSDKGPGGRGMVAWGSAIGDEAPQAKLPAGARFQGYSGGSSGPSGGQTHVAIYDVPRGPLVSIGAFQHAELSRYNHEPGHVVGNSYANLRIPLGKTSVANYAGLSGFTMADTCHAVNERLWDGYFFSTLAPAYKAGTGALDAVFPMKEVAFGATPLPNPRMIVLPRGGDVKFADIKAASEGHPAEAIASRIGVLGAFNINSTSAVAWKAVLASLSGQEFAVVSADRNGASWEGSSEVRFSRFGHVIRPDGYRSGESGRGAEFWQSYRALKDQELDELAREIVKEVQARGPFRSLADFVNRDPESSDPKLQRKGALQAALDRVINDKLGGDVGNPVEAPANPLGANKVIDANAPENQAAGHACYLMQGDLLQALAPTIQARGDYFRIRAAGETLSGDGSKVLARAVCEAFVQRDAAYLDDADAAEMPPDELQSEVNRQFGRRYEVTSFRWLSAEEI
jgi:hypothetical protein